MAIVLLYFLCIYTIASGQEQLLKFKHIYNAAAIQKTFITENNAAELHDATGKTILHYASSKDKDGNLIKFIVSISPDLLNKPDNDGNMPLHFAAFHGNYKGVEILLQEGAHADVINHVGKTAAHKAMGLLSFAHIKTIIHTLFNAGLEPNTPDHFGNTPLHDLAVYGKHNLYDALKCFFDASINNDEGYTPDQLVITAADPDLSKDCLKRRSRKH